MIIAAERETKIIRDWRERWGFIAKGEVSQYILSCCKTVTRNIVFYQEAQPDYRKQYCTVWSTILDSKKKTFWVLNIKNWWTYDNKYIQHDLLTR